MGSTKDVVLVVDDDMGISRMLRTLLVGEGFEVVLAHNGTDGIEAALTCAPDVVLLDVMMPGMSGFDMCRRLRAHPKTSYVCVILVTAKAGSSDKVEGLRAGADDFITKPFDPDELVERVRAALRKSRDLAALNPLTKLPGNEEIRRRLEERLAGESPFALLHVDIDNFKSFNDYYGLQRGDAAIGALADSLREVAESADGIPFIGHTGGDDMVLIVEQAEAEAIAASLISSWDGIARGLYEREDLERGYVEAIDRDGHPRRFAVMTLSIGIAMSDQREPVSHWQISDIASRMKNVAKRRAVSTYECDRREGPLRVDEIAPKAELQFPPVAENTLLVVDDNPMIREVLTTYCEAKGFNVLQAENGIEAYKLVVQHQPAFVVLDYKMPHLDGRYTAELIREVAPGATILALSAYLDSKPEWADVFVQKHELHSLPDVIERLRAKETKKARLPD